MRGKKYGVFLKKSIPKPVIEPIKEFEVQFGTGGEAIFFEALKSLAKPINTEEHLKQYGMKICIYCNKIHAADFTQYCENHNNNFEPSDGFID